MDERTLRKARNYCFQLLSRRNRSRYELDSGLKRNGYGPEVIDIVLTELEKSGLIDDLKFASEWIASRLSSSPRGKRRLRRELREKGVPAGEIDRAFEMSPELDNERKIAAKALRRRTGSSSIPTDRREKARLYRFLVGRGFSPEVAGDVLNEHAEF